MELAAVAVGAVIPKLSELLREEFMLTKRLRGKIEVLQRELESVHAVIRLQSGAEPSEEEVMLFRNARELSYDIEDSVDAFIVRIERYPGLKPKGIKGFLTRTMKLLTETKILHKFSTEITDIRYRIQEVSNRRDRYKVHNTVSATTVDPRVLALYKDASILVGLDDPREELSNILLMEEGEKKDPDSAARLKVVSIVGFGGVGKTTLAREVYNKTKAHFDCTAWICVAPNPDMRKILIEILHQVDDRHTTVEDDERDLILKIRESLQRKRYLIILDDIWDLSTWEIVKCALPSNSVGSRIITTTRSSSVAESCSQHWNDCVYKIKPLGVKDSRILFLRRIFGSEHSCPEDFAEILENILKKCAGFPLAITTVSSLLANEPSREKWQAVCNSIGAAAPSIEGLKNILLLSYNSLPHQLKICFLYLSIFPEDYVINRACIIRRWIAEGFILENHGKTEEQVGESYFNELINRGMIQPHDISYDGMPEACRIHDIILDLIRSKSTEENFVTFLGDDLPVSMLQRNIRRLSIFCIRKAYYDLERMDTTHLRSLSIFGNNVGPALSFDRFVFLRVLDLEGCQDLKNHNVKEIAELIHLRYLSIRDTPISELPDQISQLQKLTTLDIRDTKVHKLPMSVVRLQGLVHLLCGKMRFPAGIGKMAALSCLSQFDILQSEISVVEELGNLSQLRELVLWWFPDIESDNTERDELLAISLYRLNKLQSLSIHGYWGSVDFFDHLHHPLRQLHRIQLNSCYLSRIPEWFKSLAKLSYACINVKEVQNKDLQLLSELPLLLHLSLSSKAMPTEKLAIRSSGFRVLREFHLHNVRADLTFEPLAMLKLEKLLLSLSLLHVEKYGFSINIDQLVCLKEIDITIYGNSAYASQLFEDAGVAIRKDAEKLPNRPRVNIVMDNSIYYAAKKGKAVEQEIEQTELN